MKVQITLIQNQPENNLYHIGFYVIKSGKYYFKCLFY